MSNVNFFIPISFGNQPKTTWQTVIEPVDDYFYLGGKKACIIDNSNESKMTVLLQKQTPLISTCLKVISYFTIVTPLILLLAKLLTRATTNYLIDDQLQARLPENPLLCDFYEKKGIFRNDASPIQILDLETLGLNLEEEITVELQDYNPVVHPLLPRTPLNLRQATVEVIAQINENIRRAKLSGPESSIEQIRQIYLNTKGPWEIGGSNLYFYCHEDEIRFHRPFSDENNLWINKIITALVNSEHLYQIHPANGYGYFLQA